MEINKKNLTKFENLNILKKFNEFKINKIINLLNKNKKLVIIYDDFENKNLVLERNNLNKNIITIQFIKSHKILKNNINKKIDEIYKKEIIHFINILDKKLSHCNFDLLNKNLVTLKIKHLKDKKYTLAMYNSFSNKISINKKNYKNTITHELLHLASCKKFNNNHTRVGFDFHNNGFNDLYVGIFINEGYTEYLNSKYFSSTGCYETNKSFAHLIQLIIGEKLMEKMYFNADVEGFINELMKYNNTKEEVIKFIINTDIIHSYLYNKSNKFKIKKALNEVNDFLIKTYYTKLKTFMKNEENINETMKLFVWALSLINIKSLYNENYINNIEKYINYEHTEPTLKNN